MAYDLLEALPRLLPRAIAWAELQSIKAAREGEPLREPELETARRVGVREPELVRVMVVDRLPLPDDPLLKEAAVETGLLGPHTAGLTLGHSILVARRFLSARLLSHELRHVHRYENYGSIAAFLPAYLGQIAVFGYADAPLELDARAREREAGGWA